MDTKKLEALATAVELGSFTRAAEMLGYTQSGLTHMMNSLEKDFGFPVLVRGRAGVRLTAAGFSHWYAIALLPVSCWSGRSA